MKKTVFVVMLGLLLSGFSYAAPKSQTFTGEIMDSQCAAMGSHETMLKKEGMADKDPKDPMAKKMCIQGCVKMGGKYVLLNAETGAVYQLDDQKKPADFAGEKVTVKGTLDENSKTIHVQSIKKAS